VSYTNTSVENFSQALLSLSELKQLRAYDLRLARGDFNEDHVINAADIDLLQHNKGNADFDLNGDGTADQADTDTLIRTILGTNYGDANLDGVVDTLDFNRLAANFGQSSRGWSDGDFTGEGVVDTTDFTQLAANFGFQGATTLAPSFATGAAVPEPLVCIPAVFALAWTSMRRRR